MGQIRRKTTRTRRNKRLRDTADAATVVIMKIELARSICTDTRLSRLLTETAATAGEVAEGLNTWALGGIVAPQEQLRLPLVVRRAS